MSISRRIACFSALVAIGAAAIAQASIEPCFKNHYILDEPCALGWIAVNSGLTDLDVRVLAIDPVNKTTLYAGGPRGVFKSIDGGLNWNMTGLEMQPRSVADTAGAFRRFGDLPSQFVATSIVTQLAIDSANPNTLYAATIWSNSAWYGQRRLFKSTDGGDTWTDSVSPRINGVDNIHSIAMAPNNPATLYLANFDDSTGDTWSPLVRTTDGAATWTYLGYPVLNVLAVDPLDSRTVYAGTFDFEPYFTSLPNGVLKSVDGGATWAATGLTGTGITVLTLGAGTAPTLYAATTVRAAVSGWSPSSQGLFKSADGGATWAAVNYRPGDIMGFQASVVSALVVDPDDSNTVYVGTSFGGVLRSVDAGATWTPFNDGLPSLPITSLALAAGNPVTLYAGTPSGVFKITASEIR